MRKIIVFFTVLALLISTGVIWLKRNTDGRTTTFTTTDVEVRNIVQHQYVSGTITSLSEVDIVPHISGIVEQLFVETGQAVQQGQPIAKIKLVAAPSNKEGAKANLNLASLKYDLANKEYQRSKESYQQHIISKSEFELAESNWMQAQEEVATATKQLEIAEKGYVAGDHDISDIIRATISGTVVDIAAKEGSSVIERNNFNSGTVIVTIADMDKLMFKGKVGEKDIGHLKPSMPFSVRIPALDNAVYAAELSYIGTKGVDDNGIIRFDVEGRIKIGEQNPVLNRTGYSGVAQIVMAQADRVLSVDEKDIIYRDEVTYIEIMNDSKKEFSQIQVGVCDGIYCEVKSGLSKEDKIIVQE